MTVINKKTLGNIAKVSGSNILNLTASVLAGFLLPKILGVSDYGYYKTFTLYKSYIGWLHFGIVDGIYIKYGGYDYSDMEQSKFQYYTKTLVLIEGLVAITVALISISILHEDLLFIFLSLSIYIIIKNLTTYYQYISQITGRFTEYATRTILMSCMTVLIICLFYVLNRVFDLIISYSIFIISVILLETSVLGWYVYTYRRISFGCDKRYHDIDDVFSFAKNGLPLMVSNLVATLILTLDRQFVNVLFSKYDYAIYAFAYNMLALVTTATSAVSTVLYPTLKRTDANSLREDFPRLVNGMTILMFFCNFIYFPLDSFVKWFLPDYARSLDIFRIIFPGLAISATITIVMHNYYKAINRNLLYFRISLVVLGVSFFLNYFAYQLYYSMAAISCASIISMMIWLLLAQRLFVIEYNYSWKKNFVYIVIMCSVFYGSTSVNNLMIGFLIYFLALCFITILFHKHIATTMLYGFTKILKSVMRK